MILHFPDADAFRLVLTTGVVTPDILKLPIQAAISSPGEITVECDAKLTKKATADLSQLGVSPARSHVAEPVGYSCWLQLLPAQRLPKVPTLGNQQPVLLELESARDFTTVLSEMLRLGNDRQSLRWLAPLNGRDENRVLIRVISPPYYTLLRAVDASSSNTIGRVNAYLEAAPRVWVQFGYSHHLAQQIQVADDQLLLVKANRAWEYLPDAPFQDVYETLNLELPNKPTAWTSLSQEERLRVPLKLIPGNAAEMPELWVLRGQGIQRLDEFVRDADERIIQRLKFAVARNSMNEEVVVLRVINTKLAPPTLPLTGIVGYRPYYKLPNLYLPAGQRLHPALRRDAVRKLLADNTDELVWLEAEGQGRFTPHTLPEDSFRPLDNWVSYVIESNVVPLTAWLNASSFAFDHFLAADGQPPKPPKDSDEKDQKSRKRPKDDDSTLNAPRVRRNIVDEEGDQETPSTSFTQDSIVLVEKNKSEWEIRRAELEDQFHAIGGNLDDPARLRLWPLLAQANTNLGSTDEAVLCWANAAWELKSLPAEMVKQWLRAEFPQSSPPLTATELDKRLKTADPSVREIGQLAAMLMELLKEPKEWLINRLPAIQRYIEAHENKLPVRVAWIVGSQLASVGGADTLGLARTRDRLLQRLFENGMTAEKDLPTFLRFAGIKDSERARQVREKSLELHRYVRKWAEESLKSPASAGQSDQGATLGYIDLLFAFAMAKLGESSAARNLVESAGHQLLHYKAGEDRAIAANFLHKAFKSRIEAALQGKPVSGLLDPTLNQELDQIHSRANGQTNNPHGMAHYVINRLREQSRILEPQEKLDPYAEWMRHGDELKRELADLPKERNPDKLVTKIRSLYRHGTNGKPTAEGRFHVLLEGLPLSQRAGEALTFELIELVPGVMEESGKPGVQISELGQKQGRLLERAIGLAAHFDRREVVTKLVDQFMLLLRNKSEDQRLELINVVAGQSLRSLRKLGLKDEIDKLLRRLRDLVTNNQSLAQLRQKIRGKSDRPTPGRPDAWAKSLQSLLHIAGGWLTFGLSEQAAPILEDARQELLTSTLPAKDYTALAQAYVSALGNGPGETGLARILELYQKMNPSRITNSFTTCKFYSRFHLNLVEETVLAIVSDDFVLGTTARRWLDEDEQLVRRRIHRDMRELLQKAEI